MILTVYLCGLAVTTVAALLLARHRRRSEPLVAAALALSAGVLWPVVVLGGLQVACVAIVATTMRAADSEHDRVAVEAEPELVSSAAR